MINLTGLWPKTSQKGTQYLAGSINVTPDLLELLNNNEKVYLNIFKKDPDPNKPNAPMYSATVSAPKQKQNNVPQNDFFESKPIEPGPLAEPVITEEDVPF